MKALFVALTIGLGLLLGGCQTMSLGGGQSPSEIVGKVQSKAMEICNYVPRAQAIVAISNVKNKTIDTVNDYAVAICTAVRNSANPVVEGVPLKG